MNWKTWVPLVLAIVLGVCAAKVARDALMKNRSSAGSGGKFVNLVVPRDNIPPGRALAADDLTVTEVGAGMAPATAFRDPSQLVGRVSETLIVKGQPIVDGMLAPPGSGSGLQALVPPGMRAVTLEVNEYTGVAGLITPGCHVDILATINEGNGGQIARTIVQNVKVTAVGQRTVAAPTDSAQPNEPFRSVTVLAPVSEVETIELACATGRPRLVLRGGRDSDRVESAGITLKELRGTANDPNPFIAIALPATQPAPVAPPVIEAHIARRESPRRIVKLIRNGVESNVTLLLRPESGTENTSTDTSDPFEPN
jgi:pilus assembly protein CpaB